MTAKIRCYVGVTDRNIKVPPLDFFGKKSIAQLLSEGSCNRENVHGLMLQLSGERLYYPVTQKRTTANQLNKVLHQLLNKPATTGKTKVNKIGLIYSRYYYAGTKKKTGVLGLMFDVGFTHNRLGPVNNRYLQVPRQGCAVFLGAIQKHRSSGHDTDFESVFTSVHELGHVFNLWHTKQSTTFMSTSRSSGPYGYDACRFNVKQRRFLFNCRKNSPDSRYVHPGASSFDQRGQNISRLVETNAFNAVSYTHMTLPTKRTV